MARVKWVVVVTTAKETSIVGPFDSKPAAVQWALSMSCQQSLWRIARLHGPEFTPMVV